MLAEVGRRLDRGFLRSYLALLTSLRELLVELESGGLGNRWLLEERWYHTD